MEASPIYISGRLVDKKFILNDFQLEFEFIATWKPTLVWVALTTVTSIPATSDGLKSKPLIPKITNKYYQ